MEEFINDRMISSFIVKYGDLVLPDYDIITKKDDSMLLSFIDDLITNIPNNTNELIYLLNRNDAYMNDNIIFIGNTMTLILQSFNFSNTNRLSIMFEVNFTDKEKGINNIINYFENKNRIYSIRTEENIGIDKSIINYDIALRPNRNVTLSINYDSDDRGIKIFISRIN